MNRNKILLLDGTGLVYRAYFAFIKRPLTTSRGENTSAIFGFFRILFQILRDFKPYGIAIAFDLSRETFRNEIYASYKAHRDETPPDLKPQIPIVIDILKKMELPVLEIEGFEADDIIGTLSERLGKENDIYIVSSDKDLLQLVNNNVQAIRPQHGISEINLINREGVKEAFGVYPEQIPDYLAITGDSSDNIPGVKGLGDKGAMKLLSVYSSLEDIYEHIGEITGAVQTKLIESKEMAFLSKKLAQIHMNVPVDADVIERGFQLSKLLNPEVQKSFEHYQLNSLVTEIQKLQGEEPPKPSSPEKPSLFSEEETSVKEFKPFTGKYTLITQLSVLNELIGEIKKKLLFSLETETTSPIAAAAELIGISITLKEGSGYFIPILYDTPRNFESKTALELLKPLLEDVSIKKIGQNMKYEIEIFENYGILLRGYTFDTMLAAYLINPTRAHNSLESLVQEYLGLRKKDYKEVMKSILKKDKTLLDAAIKDVVDYSCSDSDATFRLYPILKPLIEQNGLTSVFNDIELPLAPVLGKMELKGVKIDIERLSALSKELQSGIEEQEKKIYQLAGRNFNINSPAQLGKVLFEEQGLEAVKKTEGGKTSTDEEVLSILANIHPLPAEILKYRTYSKLKNTYVDSLPALIVPKTGRIHTNFNQTVAATGRLSSSDPNLQNIPIRDEIGRKIREAFIAGPGHVLISADYSQIELRVLAHFCGDDVMKKAFTEKLDIHRHTASLVFHIPENEVTEDMRRRAKSVNFGIIYGLQAYGLSRQLGIPMAEAKLFIQNYFESFPKVRAFVDGILTGVSQTGEVRTLSGRYRKFPELVGKPVKFGSPLSTSQRMALNARIQGSAADIIKIAMIRLSDEIEKRKMKSTLILQIHDELVVEAPLEEADTIKKMMSDIMENSYQLDIPIEVDIGQGKNWSEAH